jgi:hypothetical protein
MNSIQITNLVDDVINGLEDVHKAQDILNYQLLQSTTMEQEYLLTEALLTIREVELSILN